MSHDIALQTSPSPRPGPDRRSWLKRLSLALGGLATLMAGLPILGYIFGAFFRTREDQWIRLGPVDKFPLNETTLVTFANPLRQPWDGMTAATAAYVRRLEQDRFVVFAVNCTHLGCPVSWFPQAGLFMCPCHGGVYYGDGAHASGPPPRGLYKYVWEVEKGQLKIKGGHIPTLQDTLRHPEDV